MVNRVLSTHGLQGCLRCRQTRLPERGNERSSRPEISSEASELEVVPNISVYIPWLNADWCGHTLLQRWEENRDVQSLETQARSHYHASSDEAWRE